MWLFIVGVGTPIGLQAGRILLAHLSTPLELSRYSLIAQIYAVCWSALTTAGYAYWPIFVKRRAAREQTVRMWWQLTGTFAAVAAIAMLAFVPLAPLATRVLSGGRIEVSVWLASAFAALLIVQAVHLPSTVLLTRPTEARWQAIWAMVMAALSVGLGLAVVARFGAVGVCYAAALAILVAQVLPDLTWAPRLVRRRPRVDD
jgi:O-antigen/teichoic acid export membrane protein